MDRLKNSYDALYSTNLEDIEKNLDGLIKSKHEHLKERLETEKDSNE